MSDPARELTLSAIRGDATARADLLGRHLESLRAYVASRLGRGIRARESSQDLVQSICREALEDLDQFEYRGEDSFRDWLLRRAENKIRDRGRFWGRDRRSLDREVPIAAARTGTPDDLGLQLGSLRTPSRDAVAREELLRVETAFLRLPPDYREVIRLARVEGFSHREVAQRMRRSELATRSLLSRALARLATVLDSGH
jgi:RNA polymerase sigma-70 factor (ECF subfamily)